MADLKMLAGMQIGGSRYPEKRRINLYQRRIKKSTVALELAAFALFGVALYVFVRVGVLLPMQQAEHAEMVYQNMASQLETMRAANGIFNDVSAEYAHCGSSFMSDEEKNTPDRLVMINTLETKIFPQCKSISDISVSDDQMVISCILPKGTVLSELVGGIEQDDAVRYVTASIESTQKDQTAGADDRLAAQKAVNATLTVMFKLPGESGETS